MEASYLRLILFCVLLLSNSATKYIANIAHLLLIQAADLDVIFVVSPLRKHPGPAIAMFQTIDGRRDEDALLAANARALILPEQDTSHVLRSLATYDSAIAKPDGPSGLLPKRSAN